MRPNTANLLRITLSPTGDFILIAPDGHEMLVPNTPKALGLLQQIVQQNLTQNADTRLNKPAALSQEGLKHIARAWKTKKEPSIEVLAQAWLNKGNRPKVDRPVSFEELDFSDLTVRS